MEDYDLVLVREPVTFNVALFVGLLAGGYILVGVAMLVRACLHLGRRRSGHGEREAGFRPAERPAGGPARPRSPGGRGRSRTRGP